MKILNVGILDLSQFNFEADYKHFLAMLRVMLFPNLQGWEIVIRFKGMEKRRDTLLKHLSVLEKDI